MKTKNHTKKNTEMKFIIYIKRKKNNFYKKTMKTKKNLFQKMMKKKSGRKEVEINHRS